MQGESRKEYSDKQQFCAKYWQFVDGELSRASLGERPEDLRLGIGGLLGSVEADDEGVLLGAVWNDVDVDVVE